VLANDELVPNGLGLFIIDVPNNDDVPEAGFVFTNTDGEVLAGNVETPVCPNIVVLVDDVNGLELATDALLNEVNGEEIVGAGLEANGYGLIVENGFVAGGLNGLLVRAKAFCCDDGKLGAAAGVPEGFGPPASTSIKSVAFVSQEKFTICMDQRNPAINNKQLTKGIAYPNLFET